ncbi:MAG: hypothetical protein LC135_00765 [Phycisphaerae bacterium]|nr:hypothetical protein [Phycisphaerae bacterium]
MSETRGNKGSGPRHPWLYALREARMPGSVWCEGRRFDHVETFKHDFFAATGLYRDEAAGALAVLKLGRQTPLPLSVPAAWIGRFLTRREVRMYRALAGTPGVPRFIGVVGDEAGFLHEFIPGHPLGREERVSDTFFGELRELVRGLHARHMAYVDLNKRQNILVGDDGRPYLIDFQISLSLPPVGWRGLPPVRWLLARFQHGDWYHVLKHQRRLRPEQLSEDDRRVVERLSLWIRLHRLVARPLTQLRRRILRRLNRDGGSIAGASAK